MNAILNNQEIPLEIMDTPQSRSLGMMNCNISLDILFIVNGKINNISKDCQPCVTQECNHYSGIADSVLELPGGYCEKNNVVVGDELSLY